jgi:hypothetical protein
MFANPFPKKIHLDIKRLGPTWAISPACLCSEKPIVLKSDREYLQNGSTYPVEGYIPGKNKRMTILSSLIKSLALPTTKLS